ncbi:MAG: hypothetical protein EOO01_33400, partial [Chitinophagaceae bacterium]
MNFINPGFLFALSALLIPVIIHLFNFRRFKKVYFSNVQFLKEVKEQNSSRDKLKNLLILAARMLALLFLVFAFARPYIAGKDATTPGTQQSVNIYLDNSQSMASVNKEGNLLDNARRSALAIAQSYDRNARFRLVTNDFEGKHHRLMSYDEFRNAVDEVRLSAASRTFQEVLNRQRGSHPGETDHSYIISDFQTTFTGSTPLKANAGTRLDLIKLNATNTPNVSADSAWFISPVHQPDAAEKLVIRLKNFGDEDARDISVRLSVNGQQKAVTNVDIPARGQSL